ncbi:hypothetical protein [Alkalicoccus saliphilus]|uniref:Uncharacterized protein n=1 Tax=Alkalicoccus saliphilus TaxID=200989 RepID=A0A2T4U918_9BACI|nr:hypothetical protein [Alkalicoccus saliphilus]PTL39888.1 hypothetical protein C6Y45_04385 [Alkalicoccus saliphilus]
MNHNRNDRINQVQGHTLIIGIDISKRHRYARGYTWQKDHKAWKFLKSRDGFSVFEQALRKFTVSASMGMEGGEKTGESVTSCHLPHT